MTYEEAKGVIINTYIRFGRCNGKTVFLKAIKKALEAVDKQMPKKPKGDYHSCPHYRCPNCNSSVKMYEHDNTYPHCAFCGQALDWSEEND